MGKMMLVCHDAPLPGLVPDWGPRYHRLAKLLWEYLDAEHTKLDASQRKEAGKAKAHAKGE